jgi:hypothetical protein
MLTLQKILTATPLAIRLRAKDQCFGQAYKPPRKATNVTKSGGYLVEDESGQYREFRYKAKCTDGWRKVVVRFYGPISVNTPVWCACSCPYFKYHCEVALAKRGSSAIIQSDGQRPRFTNSTLSPRICKHAYLVFMLALRRRKPDQDVLKPTNSLIGRVARRVAPRNVWVGEGTL